MIGEGQLQPNTAPLQITKFFIIAKVYINQSVSSRQKFIRQTVGRCEVGDAKND